MLFGIVLAYLLSQRKCCRCFFSFFAYFTFFLNFMTSHLKNIALLSAKQRLICIFYSLKQRAISIIRALWTKIEKGVIFLKEKKCAFSLIFTSAHFWRLLKQQKNIPSLNIVVGIIQNEINLGPLSLFFYLIFCSVIEKQCKITNTLPSIYLNFWRNFSSLLALQVRVWYVAYSS